MCAIAKAQAKGSLALKAAADVFAANTKPHLDNLKGMSAQATARKFNERGVPTASGGKWSATTVIRAQRRLEAM